MNKTFKNIYFKILIFPTQHHIRIEQKHIQGLGISECEHKGTLLCANMLLVILHT
jgi:hypothetical protein